MGLEQPQKNEVNDVLLLRIARHLILNASFLTDLGLYHGKMGIVIFFVHYARYTGKELYNEFAGELLDEIFQEIHNEILINFESGLCGIGWGIEYLLENGFMEGDSDEILEDLDQKVMEKNVRRIKDESLKTGLQGIFYYVDKRLKSKPRGENNLPFDENYLTDWKLFNRGENIEKGRKVLSSIIGEFSVKEPISKWLLGLEKGCAGYGLNLILG